MINGFEIRRCSGEMRVYESDGEMNGNTCVYLFSFALRGWNILSTRARWSRLYQHLTCKNWNEKKNENSLYPNYPNVPYIWGIEVCFGLMNRKIIGKKTRILLCDYFPNYPNPYVPLLIRIIEIYCGALRYCLDHWIAKNDLPKVFDKGIRYLSTREERRNWLWYLKA